MSDVNDDRLVAIQAGLRQISSVLTSHPSADQFFGHAQMLATSHSLREVEVVEIIGALERWAEGHADSEPRYAPQRLPGPKTLRRLLPSQQEPDVGPQRTAADHRWGRPGAHPLFALCHEAFGEWCGATVPALEQLVEWQQTPAYEDWLARRGMWERWLPKSSDEIRAREDGGEELEIGIHGLNNAMNPEVVFEVTLGEAIPQGNDHVAVRPW